MIYFIVIICLTAILILNIVKIFIEKKYAKKYAKIVAVIGILIFFITTFVGIINMEVPQPEIYTSNGSNLNDNYIYIKSQPFF